MNLLLSGSRPPVEIFDVALLDLDGVVYIGPHVVEHAAEVIRHGRERGMRFGFVTNNAARLPSEVAAHLSEIDVPADPHDVVTSSQAGARLLAERLAPGERVLAVGGPGVALSLIEHGLRPVSSVDDAPQAILQGFGRDVGWQHLAEASLAVRRGAYWVATNLDATFPVPGGRAPGNGMLVAAVAEAAGRWPDAVAGKPHAPLMVESVDRLQAARPIVVGDRLDTDIAGADGLGIPSLLVLTGVTDVARLLAAQADERPSLIARDMRGLLDPHPPVERVGDDWRARTSLARARNGKLEVQHGPEREDWEDAVRCACAAAWAMPDLDTHAAAVMLEQDRPEGPSRVAAER